MKDVTIGIIVFIIVIALLCLVACRGCISPVTSEDAIEVAKNQGYSNAKVVSRDYLFVGYRGCSDEDSLRFVIKAKNPLGKSVQIYVCTGFWLKGATVRSDI